MSTTMVDIHAQPTVDLLISSAHFANVAPSDAELTNSLYFASIVPAGYLSAGGFHSRSRDSSSSCGTCKSMVLLSMSISTVSPSCTTAKGPPSCASGVTWPQQMPCEAPLKRPSVTSAHLGSTAAPLINVVTSSRHYKGKLSQDAKLGQLGRTPCRGPLPPARR
jgi:hypothetical protein